MTATWTRGGETVSRDYAINVVGVDDVYITNRCFKVDDTVVGGFTNGDTVTFVVDAYNTATEIGNAVAAIALYNGDKLEKMAFDTNAGHTVNTGAATLTASVTVPETGDYTIKGFVFNCEAVLEPYCNPLPIGMIIK